MQVHAFGNGFASHSVLLKEPVCDAKARTSRQNLIRLCNQFGVVTRPFFATSTANLSFSPSAQEADCARRSESLIFVPIFGIANIRASNIHSRRCNSMAILGIAFQYLEFIVGAPLSRYGSAGMLTYAGLPALHRIRRQMRSPAPQVRSSFPSSGSISR